jgi:hypothetical protein
MKTRGKILLGMLFGGLALFAGCLSESGEAGGALDVSELLESPVYDTQIEVYGEVSLLGQLLCPCFELTSGGGTILVWYGLMVEDDGTEWPSVSVESIENGDRVIATGELKTEGTHRSHNDFWASRIEKVE